MKVESTNVILVKLSAPNNNQNGTKNTLNFGSDGIICTSQSYSSEFSALKEFVCGFSHGSSNLLTYPLEFPKKEKTPAVNYGTQQKHLPADSTLSEVADAVPFIQ